MTTDGIAFLIMMIVLVAAGVYLLPMALKRLRAASNSADGRPVPASRGENLVFGVALLVFIIAAIFIFSK